MSVHPTQGSTEIAPIAVVDFDGTLVEGDSILDWLQRERLWRDPRLLAWGVALMVVRRLLPPRGQLFWRSRFKRRLLTIIRQLPRGRWEAQVERFRLRLIPEVVAAVRGGGYNQVVIASASQEDFIAAVLEGHLVWDRIVACRWPEARVSFRTCWGPEKLRRLQEEGVLPHGAVHVYTDSHDDDPLCSCAAKVFWVRERRLHEKLP